MRKIKEREGELEGKNEWRPFWLKNENQLRTECERTRKKKGRGRGVEEP